MTSPAVPTASVGDHQARIRAKLRVVVIAVALMIFGFLLAAFTIPITGAVIAPGRLAPESQVKRIAHPTGGVIEHIAVQDGDRVEAGDLLMRLDTTVSAVSAELSERSVYQLLAQRARLQAEIDNRGSIRFPPDLLTSSDESARQSIAAEQRRFALNRGELASLRNQLGERVVQLNRQIDSYRSQIRALELQRELIQPELEGVRELRERGYVTLRRLNELERTAVELDGSIGALQANIAGSQARISEAREQQIQIGQTARARAGAELAEIEAMLNEQRVQSTSAGDQFERSTIRAPYSGIVDGLAYNTVGEVVLPAEPILVIVPYEDHLVLEGTVKPSDIDRVQIGQDARVRLSALNTNATPELEGSVSFVSAELVSDEENGVEFYRVRVQLSERDDRRARQLGLVPGMPAEIFIETGSRSIMSYITKPLRDQFARAFRD